MLKRSSENVGSIRALGEACLTCAESTISKCEASVILSRLQAVAYRAHTHLIWCLKEGEKDV